jgi:hypothetical protein
METLLGVKHLTRKGYYMFIYDLQNGFYALDINPTDRDYLHRERTRTTLQLAGLPMG